PCGFMQSAATTIGEISQPVTGSIARGIAAAVAGSVAVVVAGAGVEARIGDSAARFDSPETFAEKSALAPSHCAQGAQSHAPTSTAILRKPNLSVLLPPRSRHR